MVVSVVAAAVVLKVLLVVEVVLALTVVLAVIPVLVLGIYHGHIDFARIRVTTQAFSKRLGAEVFLPLGRVLRH